MNDSVRIPAALPVEFTERMVYVISEWGFIHPQLGAVVSFDGRLDETRLRKSLVLLLQAEPVLGCRFVPDAKPPVWQRIKDVDAAALLRVVESEDAAADAAKFVAEAFDPCVGPQLLGALLHGPRGDTLAIKMAHVAVDGGAVKETLYLIGEFYRVLEEKSDWTPEPNLDGVRHPVARGGFIERTRALRSSGVKMPPSDWASTDLGGRGRPTYFVVDLERDVLRSAAGLGRTAGATINDIILTAYYRTLWRLLSPAPDDRTPMQISCELRKHLPAGTKTALSNISGIWYISIQPIADEDFEGTLARVVQATSAWKRSGAGKPAALMMPFVTKIMGRQSLDSFRKMMGGGETTVDDNSYPTLTNIGVIEEERLEFGSSGLVLDAWLLGPLSFGMPLTASTFRDRLHLSVGAELDAVDEKLASGIAKETGEEIVKWVEAHKRVRP